MKGMPLLVSCIKPYVGPDIPVKYIRSRVRVEGELGEGRVEIYGRTLKSDEAEKLGLINCVGAHLILELESFVAIFAIRYGSGPPIHVWVEDANGD